MIGCLIFILHFIFITQKRPYLVTKLLPLSYHKPSKYRSKFSYYLLLLWTDGRYHKNILIAASSQQISCHHNEYRYEKHLYLLQAAPMIHKNQYRHGSYSSKKA